MIANSMMMALMIGIIVFSVLVVAVRYALKYFRAPNISLKAAVRSMDQRVARLRAMSASCENGELSNCAMRVADGLRFGDSSIVLPLDAEIDDAIERAPQAIRIHDVSAAERELNQIACLTRQRRAEEAFSRKGSF